MTGMSEAPDAGHPTLAQPNHDELVEQLFVKDLKMFVGGALEPSQRAIALKMRLPADSWNAPVEDLRDRMLGVESFKTWIGLKRESQRHLWAAVGESVERQAD